MFLGLSNEAVVLIGLLCFFGGFILTGLTGHWIFMLVSIAGAVFFGIGLDCLGTIPGRTCYPEVVPEMLPLSPEKQSGLTKGVIGLIVGLCLLPLLHAFRKKEERRIHGPKTLAEWKREAEKNGEYPSITWATDPNDPSKGFTIHTRSEDGTWFKTEKPVNKASEKKK